MPYTRTIRNQRTVAGVDGCKGGWVAVKIHSGGRWQIDIYPDVATLWKEVTEARLILIDIPIGLPDRKFKSRRCDIEARRAQGSPRASSIFSPPCRAALGSSLSYKEACCRNNAEVGKKLSQQAYWIRDKIKQVDDLLQNDPNARCKLREIHPEICFWALNGRRAMQHNKKTEHGFHERLRVLSRVFPASRTLIEEGLEKHRRKCVARDDLVDALVAALTGTEPDTCQICRTFWKRMAAEYGWKWFCGAILCSFRFLPRPIAFYYHVGR